MNKIFIFFIVQLAISFPSVAQTKVINAGGIEMQVSPVDTALNIFFCQVGQMPEFPGGLTKLVAFAKSSIKYPEKAINDHIEGSVVLQFVIDEKGKVTSEKIIESVRADIDSVCLGMLKKMPDWKPAQFGDKAISANERWKIKFVLIN
mgnify:CR=1 FL=1